MKFEESLGDARVNFFLDRTIGRGLCICERVGISSTLYCGPGVGDSRVEGDCWCPVHDDLLRGIPSIKEFKRLEYLAEEYLKVNRG